MRRVELKAQLVAGVDPLDAIARLKAAVGSIPNVAAEPAPEVDLLDINLVGPVIAVRPYTHTDNYWQVYFDTNRMMARVAGEAGWPAPAAPSCVRPDTASLRTDTPWQRLFQSVAAQVIVVVALEVDDATRRLLEHRDFNTALIRLCR